MLKKKTILIGFVLASSAAFTDKPNEVRDYLVVSTKTVQTHLEALSAATTANQAAAVLNKYATAMKTVMKKSQSIKKKYPDFATDASLQTEMEAMSKIMEQMNQKIGEARQKYGKDRKFKQAEKALQKAGLFGPG